jgi:PBP1b-binding outer membrane lipoprotein LpoB
MRQRIYILFLFAFLSGCITANITSTKDQNYTEKIDNVLIVMRGVDLADAYLVALRNLMSQSFNQRGIKTYFHILASKAKKEQKLSLLTEEDETTKINIEIAAQVTKYSPSYLLTINQTHVKEIYGNINAQEGGTFDIRLIDSAKGNMIWRASLEIFSNQGFKNGAELSNQKIFEKLTADGLVKKL